MLLLLFFSDGTVVNAQIHMLLEDILWVATLPQLRSAIAFSSYIMSLVRQSEKEFPPVRFLFYSFQLANVKALCCVVKTRSH